MDQLSLDGHKLFYHLEPVVKWLNGEQIYPLYCAISLTEACNHKCLFCVYDYIQRTKTYLDRDAVLGFVKELADGGMKAAYFSGEGEPLMHPQAVEIMRETRAAGVDCALNTNGSYLTKEISRELLSALTYVRFSINGCSPENYRQIHRTTAKAYDRIMANLEDAVAIRKDQGLDITLGAQCVVLGENIDLIPDLARDLKSLQIDYLSLKPFLPFDLVDYRTDLDLQNDDVQEKLRACEKIGDGNFKVVVRWDSINKIEKRTYDRCLSVPFMLEVDAKGETYLCGVLLGREGFSYGNINEKSYREIIESAQCGKVVERINGIDVHKCMPNCRNDAVNRFLWDLKHPPEHVNFI